MTEKSVWCWERIFPFPMVNILGREEKYWKFEDQRKVLKLMWRQSRSSYQGRKRRVHFRKFMYCRGFPPRRILKTILPFRKVLKWNYEENILHISGFPNRISTFRDLKSKEAPFKALSLRIECRDWMERETPLIKTIVFVRKPTSSWK